MATLISRITDLINAIGVDISDIRAKALGSAKPYAALSGTYQPPSHYIAGGSGNPTAQSIYFMPYLVGPGGQSVSGLAVGCLTAIVGGSGHVFTLGLYQDDGTGGAPKTNGGQLGTVTITATSTGNKATNFAAPIDLDPGTYWLAFLYTNTTGPTTAAAFNCISTALSLWYTTGVSIGSPVKAHVVTTQTALPTATALTMAPHTATSAPCVVVKVT